MPEYVHRIITERSEATPGAIRFGPSGDPERYRYGTKASFLAEVGFLDDDVHSHDLRLKRYVKELEDSPPSLKKYREQRVAEYKDFIRCLRGVATDATRDYEDLARLGVRVE